MLLLDECYHGHRYMWHYHQKRIAYSWHSTLDDYKYKTITGTEATRYSSKITFGVKPGVSTSIDIIDCEQASQNYNPSLHDYLPLPLGEILTNPNVKQ